MSDVVLEWIGDDLCEVKLPADAVRVAEVYRRPGGEYMVLSPTDEVRKRVSSGAFDRHRALSWLDCCFKKADDHDWAQPEHSQVVVYCPLFDRDIRRVDVKMKPLLTALWGRGVVTQNSCQENTPRSHAWIAFEHGEDAEWFARLCGSIVKEGEVIVSYYHDLFTSVRFPKGKIRELAKLVRRAQEIGGPSRASEPLALGA